MIGSSLANWILSNAVIYHTSSQWSSSGFKRSVAFGEYHTSCCRLCLSDRNSTVSIVSLLDCAFLFYQNYPCRLTHSEMECDLPCDEAIFRSEHPFTEPNFRFSRHLTIYEAFQNLFDAPILESPQRTPDSSHMDLTVLDMFILIHSMWTHTLP